MKCRGTCSRRMAHRIPRPLSRSSAAGTASARLAWRFAPDGSLFVADWGSSSYPVHGKGRVWKVTFDQAAAGDAAPPVDEARQRAAKLRASENVPELLAALDDVDPATSQAAQFGLSRLAATEKIDWSSLRAPRQRIGLLAALLLRGTDLKSYMPEALADQSDMVRQMAVRCVTEEGITAARPDLDRLLQSQTLSPRLLGMTVAAINQLDGDRSAKVDSAKINGVLLARMNVPEATDATRASAADDAGESSRDSVGRAEQDVAITVRSVADRGGAYLSMDGIPPGLKRWPSKQPT